MKLIQYVISVAVILILSSVSLQEQVKIPAEISLALKTGNATELAKHMNSTVELLLLEKEDFYKKNIAETIIRDFFNSHQAKDFIIRHQGAKNDAQYAIGNLKTENGDFRVYFLLKKVGQDLLIHQIRIEPDSGK